MESKQAGSWAFPVAAFIVAVIVAILGFGAALATRPPAATNAVRSSETPQQRDPSLAGLSVAPDAKPDDVQIYY